MLMMLVAFGPHPAFAQPVRTASDRTESITVPAHMANDASPLKPRRSGVSPAPHVVSLPVPEVRRASSAAAPSLPGTPYRIGFGRDVPQLENATDALNGLNWQITPQGGLIAAISIRSPEAVGIRIGLLVRRLPGESMVRFYAQEADSAYEIPGAEITASIRRNLEAGDSGDAARIYWSPLVEGEEATLEIELPPGIGPDSVEISIPRVSHFFHPPLAAQGDRVTHKTGIGAADICEIDATCYPAWKSASDATARMVFVDSDGHSYLCSGTLLNDMASSGTPYFLSAYHCIAKQTVASTLQTYWFFRSTSCNGGILDPESATRTGGATLLYAGLATDTSFMRLTQAPPAGAIHIGWDSAAPVLRTSVAGIHHPKGDLQKISFGTVQSFADCTMPGAGGEYTCVATTPAKAEYIEITLTNGITEGGSSGSGLFRTIGGAPSLIGQLRGGNSSCENPDGSDSYGRFDIAYAAALHQWLGGAGSSFLLEIAKTGNGTGTVLSSPGGIDCGTTCSAVFGSDAGITLTAVPAPGSTFSGWDGACTGAGASCSLVMNSAKYVTATFTTVQPGSAGPLYFPHVAASVPWRTEIALIHTGDQEWAGTLKAYGNSGKLLETLNVVLPPHGRKEMDVAETFADPANIGYLILDAASDAIRGYTKFYREGYDRAALPAVTASNTSILYVPHIASDAEWWTGISLTNTTSKMKGLTITFDNEQSKSITLAANEHRAFTIRELFGGQPREDIHAAVITNASGVIGLELFGSVGGSHRLEGIALTGDTASTIDYPHVAGDEWWTGIVAHNPSSSGCAITITPYTDGGIVLPALTRSVGGMGKYSGEVSALGLSGQAAWIRIDATRPISGFELFGTTDGRQLAAYAAGGRGGAFEGVFPKIEKHGWTGIALVNTEETAAAVRLTAYSDSGAVEAIRDLTLGARAKGVNPAEAFFAEGAGGATYIAYSSDRRITGFQLNGSADGTMLDGLPALCGSQ